MTLMLRLDAAAAVRWAVSLARAPSRPLPAAPYPLHPGARTTSRRAPRPSWTTSTCDDGAPPSFLPPRYEHACSHVLWSRLAPGSQDAGSSSSTLVHHSIFCCKKSFENCPSYFSAGLVLFTERYQYFALLFQYFTQFIA